MASNYVAVLRQDQSVAFLQAAAAAIARDSGCEAPLKIGACRAIARMVGKVPAEQRQPLLPTIYGGLVAFLQESTEDTQHLGLECLKAVVTVGGAPGWLAGWLA